MNAQSNFSRLINLFCEEPYRLFFPLGIVIGMFGVSHWLFFALGVTKSCSGIFHASIQMQGYMSCFIIGFLMTAMPRFAAAPHATKGELFSFLTLTLGITVFLTLAWYVAAYACFVLWLLAIMRFALSRVLGRRDRKVYPPTEFVWIPIGIFHGLVGSIIMMIGMLSSASMWTVNVGKPMLLQGFLFSIVLGIGGFLGPRLMGVQQLINPENLRNKEASCAPSSLEKIRKERMMIHVSAGFLLFATFWLEGFDQKYLAYGLRALIVTAEFLFTGALPTPPRVKAVFAWLLWLSFWMVALGSWGEFLFPNYRVIMLHLVFLGGFSLMTFSVGTVVILSHAGEMPILYGRLPVLWIVGAGVLMALVIRFSADFFPINYFTFLGTAAAIWLTGALSWFFFVLPKVFRSPEPGTFDREHESVKKK
ncbi:MAG: NnrS family protein [Candidatus Omnitrophica bacterium]|nr:NnrS family protein [Candidatus Omnitrophota bacterium]